MRDLSIEGKRIWVTGHKGMVGSSIVRRLRGEKCTIITSDRREIDLRSSADVKAWLYSNKPDIVIVAAAKVGGILANSSYPADFIYDNLAIATTVIHESFEANVSKLVFLGSSCIYPKFAPQPIPESSLLTGPLEPTNEWYAIAKIAGIKMCQAYWKQHKANFISAMPTNLYGPGDNYNLETSHVLPAMIRKFHEAKVKDDPSVLIWGTGTPLREFMHVDDLANAIIFLTENYSGYEHVNIGSGEEISIANLARIVSEIVGFTGDLEFDRTKPDGTPRKLMDSSRLNAMGWKPSIAIKDGIKDAYANFLTANQ
jgi:GDP-L-fucose synthase